ncbi:hypothetical protein P8452_71740 [Trifolium repens]|nr:hypothetical protein P8452_71740 [Trifolium repens]
MSSGKVGIENPEKISGSNIPRKKANEASRRYLNETKRSTLKETERSDYEGNQPSLAEQCTTPIRCRFREELVGFV